MVQMVSINEQIIPEKVFPIPNDFVPNGSSRLKWDSPSSNLTAPQGIETTEMREALVMLQKGLCRGSRTTTRLGVSEMGQFLRPQM